MPGNGSQQHDMVDAVIAGQGLEFTEASEFARSIQLREPEEAAAEPADSAGHMGVDDTAAASASAATSQPQAPAPRPPKRNARSKYDPVLCCAAWACTNCMIVVHALLCWERCSDMHICMLCLMRSKQELHSCF